MKKLRGFVVAALLGSSFVVLAASPATAKCVGEPVNPCVIVCEAGQSNKYTADLFAFCQVW